MKQKNRWPCLVERKSWKANLLSEGLGKTEKESSARGSGWGSCRAYFRANCEGKPVTCHRWDDHLYKLTLSFLSGANQYKTQAGQLFIWNVITCILKEWFWIILKIINKRTAMVENMVSLLTFLIKFPRETVKWKDGCLRFKRFCVTVWPWPCHLTSESQIPNCLMEVGINKNSKAPWDPRFWKPRGDRVQSCNSAI